MYVKPGHSIPRIQDKWHKRPLMKESLEKMPINSLETKIWTFGVFSILNV